MVKTADTSINGADHQASPPARTARRRRAKPCQAAASLVLLSITSSFSAFHATAFLPSSVIGSVRNKNQRLMYRNVVTDPDALLLETFRSSQRDDMEKLFNASPAEARPELDEIVVHSSGGHDKPPPFPRVSNPKKLKVIGKKLSGWGPRRVASVHQSPAAAKTVKKSKSSTKTKIGSSIIFRFFATFVPSFF